MGPDPTNFWESNMNLPPQYFVSEVLIDFYLESWTIPSFQP